jgi:hypothetical protein
MRQSSVTRGNVAGSCRPSDRERWVRSMKRWQCAVEKSTFHRKCGQMSLSHMEIKKGLIWGVAETAFTSIGSSIGPSVRASAQYQM